MKLIWEEKDIVVGKRYGRYDIGEKWMIGYLPSEDDCRYVSISMDDGMVTNPMTLKDFVTSLNKDNYIPEDILPFIK